MGHDPTKFLMGATGSSDREVSCHNSDPASFPAGLAVREKNDDTLSLSSSDGQLLGVSLGKSLSDHKKTSVVRAGNRVPLTLTNQQSTGSVVITSYANLVSGTDDVIEVAGVEFTAQAGAATPGDPTFQAATNNNTTATSLAAQINAHPDLDGVVTALAASATVTITAVEPGTAGDALTLSYTDNDTNVGATVSGATLGSGGAPYAVLGAPVRVSNTTGKAVTSSGTLTGAKYISGPLTGIQEDASEILVALIDMGGGL